MTAKNVLVDNNMVARDSGGCGIVVVAWGPLMKIFDVTVENNLVTGSLLTPKGPSGPFVGTIVITADFAFSQANNNTVLNNTVIRGLEDGIIIINQAAGAKDLNNKIIGNYVKEGACRELTILPLRMPQI